MAGRHVVRDAEAVKEDIGYMSQRFGLYPDLTVMENLDFYADIYNVPHQVRQERTQRLLAFSNLTPFRRRLAGNLSGGMKQKLGLACALIHTPKVLFLDEPTNGVDPVSRRDFWRILHQLLEEKVTIFISTAYLDEAERCDRVALIHRGRQLACGTPSEVKKLMRGMILEIRTAEPRRAAAILREGPSQVSGVEDAARASVSVPVPVLLSVGLFGARVHVVTSTPEETTAWVQRVLGGRGPRTRRDSSYRAVARRCIRLGFGTSVSRKNPRSTRTARRKLAATPALPPQKVGETPVPQLAPEAKAGASGRWSSNNWRSGSAVSWPSIASAFR